MVEPESFRVILRANIDQNIKCVEHLLIPCSHNRAILVLIGVKQHGAGKDLITVETITMSSNHSFGVLLLNLG